MCVVIPDAKKDNGSLTLYLSCACLYRFLLHYLLRLLLDWFVFGNFDCSCLKCIIVSLTYCLVPRRHYVVLRREYVIEWNRGCDSMSLYEFNVETRGSDLWSIPSASRSCLQTHSFNDTHCLINIASSSSGARTSREPFQEKKQLNPDSDFKMTSS